MKEGHFKFTALSDDTCHVLFFLHDALGGGSVRAQPVHGIENLRRFMESLGCPLSKGQLFDAERRTPIKGTQETRYAAISSDSYEQYFG